MNKAHSEMLGEPCMAGVIPSSQYTGAAPDCAAFRRAVTID